MLTPYGLWIDLSAYAAAKRYAVETRGIMVAGAPIATDRQSQLMVGDAYTYVQVSGAATVSYKTTAGFVTLTVDQIKAVALAVGAHVQACFGAEVAVGAGIYANPPAITPFAQVGAALASLASAYVVKLRRDVMEAWPYSGDDRNLRGHRAPPRHRTTFRRARLAGKSGPSRACRRR